MVEMLFVLVFTCPVKLFIDVILFDTVDFMLLYDICNEAISSSIAPI